jgi:hypothetical protein
MKTRTKLIGIEILSYIVNGLFLIYYLFNPIVALLEVLLLAEYFVSLGVTIGWFTLTDEIRDG